ncbi:MAG: hypothetical protein AVDCRST_MAG64-2836 [uncultured Phycisphaerae bacterium]|uniref:Uncharacterized protein n=1 Tax=uncultured Phycisphaerae bacterium TaxID=904963 RepID=A0A6J4PMV9_9BACT|nr:MAG: hypothetical protein AVDCRST_MAG64-2836 [uncultured Phycisphaerae bacterium]
MLGGQLPEVVVREQLAAELADGVGEQARAAVGVREDHPAAPDVPPQLVLPGVVDLDRLAAAEVQDRRVVQVAQRRPEADDLPVQVALGRAPDPPRQVRHVARPLVPVARGGPVAPLPVQLVERDRRPASGQEDDAETGVREPADEPGPAVPGAVLLLPGDEEVGALLVPVDAAEVLQPAGQADALDGVERRVREVAVVLLVAGDLIEVLSHPVDAALDRAGPPGGAFAVDALGGVELVLRDEERRDADAGHAGGERVVLAPAALVIPAAGLVLVGDPGFLDRVPVRVRDLEPRLRRRPHAEHRVLRAAQAVGRALAARVVVVEALGPALLLHEREQALEVPGHQRPGLRRLREPQRDLAPHAQRVRADDVRRLQELDRRGESLVLRILPRRQQREHGQPGQAAELRAGDVVAVGRRLPFLGLLPVPVLLFGVEERLGAAERFLDLGGGGGARQPGDAGRQHREGSDHPGQRGSHGTSRVDHGRSRLVTRASRPCPVRRPTGTRRFRAPLRFTSFGTGGTPVSRCGAGPPTNPSPTRPSAAGASSASLAPRASPARSPSRQRPGRARARPPGGSTATSAAPPDRPPARGPSLPARASPRRCSRGHACCPARRCGRAPRAPAPARRTRRSPRRASRSRSRPCPGRSGPSLPSTGRGRPA